MSAVDAYFARSRSLDLCSALRALVREAAPDLSEELVARVAVYRDPTSRRILLSIAHQARKVQLGFFLAGDQLKDPKGLLHSGRTKLRYVELTKLDPDEAREICRLVKQQVRLRAAPKRETGPEPRRSTTRKKRT